MLMEDVRNASRVENDPALDKPHLESRKGERAVTSNTKTASPRKVVNNKRVQDED